IGLNYFCHGSECSDMADVSLVDTINRVRYGPLRQGSADGTPDTSREDYAYQSVGTTYRYGAFFADPAPSATAMRGDLLFGGIVPDVPIVEGTAPMPGLVADSASPSPTPSISAKAGGAGGGPLVTWTVPQPTADAFIDRHDLIAKVVGGTVNEGG